MKVAPYLYIYIYIYTTSKILLLLLMDTQDYSTDQFLELIHIRPRSTKMNFSVLLKQDFVQARRLSCPKQLKCTQENTEGYINHVQVNKAQAIYNMCIKYNKSNITTYLAYHSIQWYPCISCSNHEYENGNDIASI